MALKKYNKLTASGQVYTGKCIYLGHRLGHDSTNDVNDLAIFDGTSTSGNEIVPTCDFPANGFWGDEHRHGIPCETGIYADFTCAGSCELTVYYVPYDDWFNYAY